MSSTTHAAPIGYRPSATQVALAALLVLASVAVGAAAHRIYQLSEFKPVQPRAASVTACGGALGQAFAANPESLSAAERRLCGITTPTDTTP